MNFKLLYIPQIFQKKKEAKNTESGRKRCKKRSTHSKRTEHGKKGILQKDKKVVTCNWGSPQNTKQMTQLKDAKLVQWKKVDSNL